MATPQFQWITHQPSGIEFNANSDLPSIATDASGNSYITFFTFGTVSGGTSLGNGDVVVSKINSSGTFLWTKQYPTVNTSAEDSHSFIAVDSNGNTYIVYTTNGTVSGGTQGSLGMGIVAFKLDTNGNVQWVKQDATLGNEWDNGDPTIATDASGNVYIGYKTDGTMSSGTNAGGYDIVIQKLDTNGSNQWVKQHTAMNTSFDDIQPSLAVDASGNIYFAYNTDGVVSGGTNIGDVQDIVVVKMSSSGELAWVKQTESMNTEGYDEQPLIAVDVSGNVYVSYKTDGTVSGGANTGGANLVVFKLDTSGTLLWITQNADMNPIESYSSSGSIAVDGSGNILLCYGTSGTVSGGTDVNFENDLVAAKMDTDGNLIWLKQDGSISAPTGYNGGYNGAIPRISLDASGNMYATYPTTGTVSGGSNQGYTNVVVFKVTSSGETSWIKEQVNISTINGGNNMKVATDNQGNSYVVYVTAATLSGGVVAGYNDVVVSKLNSAGTIVWVKQQPALNTNMYDNEPSIVADSSGNVYVSYNTIGTVSGGQQQGGWDIVVFKLDTSGNLQWIKQTPAMNTAGGDFTSSIAIDGSASLYISYMSDGAISGGSTVGDFDIVLFKMSSSGDVQWIKQDSSMNTSMYDDAPRLAVDSSGNSYISYLTAGTASGGVNNSIETNTLVVAKINTNGVLQWVTQDPNMVPPDMAFIETNSITVDSSGNVYVAYNTTGTASGGVNVGLSDIILCKLDSNGSLLWVKQDSVVNTSETEWAPALSTDIYGNLYMAYHSEGTVSGGVQNAVSNLVVSKLNSNGDVQWISEDPTTNIGQYNFNPSIIVDTVGNVFVAVGNYTTMNGVSVVKYAQNGFIPSSLYCFAKGTQILTPQGYALIESLKKGDSVVTGDKRIVPIESIHTTYFGKTTEQTAPYTIEKDAFGKNCPPNALQVSGKHAIQIGEGLWEMPEEAAKSNRLVKQAPLGESVRYYHVALPDYAKDTLVANGQIVDSLNTGKYRESYVWNNEKQGYVRTLTLRQAKHVSR